MQSRPSNFIDVNIYKCFLIYLMSAEPTLFLSGSNFLIFLSRTDGANVSALLGLLPILLLSHYLWACMKWCLWKWFSVPRSCSHILHTDTHSCLPHLHSTLSKAAGRDGPGDLPFPEGQSWEFQPVSFITTLHTETVIVMCQLSWFFK